MWLVLCVCGKVIWIQNSENEKYKAKAIYLFIDLLKAYIYSPVNRTEQKEKKGRKKEREIRN